MYSFPWCQWSSNYFWLLTIFALQTNQTSVHSVFEIIKKRIDGIPIWKLIAFIVKIYTRQLPPESKSWIGYPALSSVSCLRFSCWYQSRFSVENLLKIDFVFVVLAVRPTGAFLKKWSSLKLFSWAGRIEVFAMVYKKLDYTRVYASRFICFVWKYSLRWLCRV